MRNIITYNHAHRNQYMYSECHLNINGLRLGSVSIQVATSSIEEPGAE